MDCASLVQEIVAYRGVVKMTISSLLDVQVDGVLDHIIHLATLIDYCLTLLFDAIGIKG